MPIAPLALLSKFAVPLMATGGAIAGGREAYKQSGGDIGATLLGSGIGAVTGGTLPGVTRRMAGAKGVQDVIGKAKSKLPKETIEAVKKTGLTPDQLTKLAIGGGLGLTGLAVGAPLAGMIGSGVSNVAQPVRRAVGALRPKGIDERTGLVVYGSDAVPDNLAGAADLLEQMDPLGSYQANLGYARQLQDLSLEGKRKATAYMAPILDEAKRRDLERDLAAAKVRNELAIQQGLALQGQRGAQALAQQGLSDIGAGLRQQYRYG